MKHLFRLLSRQLMYSKKSSLAYESLSGVRYLDKIINIDLPYPRKKVVDTPKYFKYITETRNTLNEATK